MKSAQPYRPTDRTRHTPQPSILLSTPHVVWLPVSRRLHAQSAGQPPHRVHMRSSDAEPWLAAPRASRGSTLATSGRRLEHRAAAASCASARRPQLAAQSRSQSTQMLPFSICSRVSASRCPMALLISGCLGLLGKAEIRAETVPTAATTSAGGVPRSVGPTPAALAAMGKKSAAELAKAARRDKTMRRSPGGGMRRALHGMAKATASRRTDWRTRLICAHSDSSANVSCVHAR